jgi:hypothetical protein
MTDQRDREEESRETAETGFDRGLEAEEARREAAANELTDDDLEAPPDD